MLCPVCNERPLRGRQATCSTKCRSTRYRERKQQQRDTSQQGGRHGSASSAPSRPSSDQKRRTSDTKKWEQFVSAAADRIIEAIQRLGHPPTPTDHAPLRVDLREQVTSQAPKLAVGYRVVLPGRYPGDSPKLLPKRSRARGVAWYSLSPFEYPDDIRLSDGYWYRIVWIDAQGQRIRLQPGESAPGLRYFVGPQHLLSRSPAANHADPHDSKPEPTRDASPILGITPPSSVASASSPSVAGADASPLQTLPDGKVPVGELLSEGIMNEFVQEFARAAKRDAERASRVGISDEQSDEPAGLVFLPK